MTKAVTLSSIVQAGKPLSDGVLTAGEISGLSTVAATGSYNDLTNKPTTDGITEGSTNKFYKVGKQMAIALIIRG